MTEKKPRAFFKLNLPRKPREGDVIVVKAKLKQNPTDFRIVLGVKTTEDRNASLEPFMIALDFKTVFQDKEIRVTTNWKTDTGWQDEEEIEDADWIDERGNADVTITFMKNQILLTDNSNSLITSFPLHFEVDRIGCVQLWGSVKELREISLKYNQKNLRRPSRNQ